MDFLTVFLSTTINLLIIGILVVGIILGIKAIITINKIDQLLDNVNDKVESLNSLFKIVDTVSTKVNGFTDSIVEFFSNLLSKVWYKKSLKKEEEYEEEE